MRPFSPILILCIISILSGCSDTVPKLPQARKYEVVGEMNMDLAAAGRTGRMWYITSPAKTFDEMSQTCILAASELSWQYRLDLTAVTLVPDKQFCRTDIFYTSAGFARDHKGSAGEPGSDPSTDHNWEYSVPDK